MGNRTGIKTGQRHIIRLVIAFLPKSQGRSRWLKEGYFLTLALTVVISSTLPSLSYAASNCTSIRPVREATKHWLKKSEHWMAFAQNQTSNEGNVCGWGKGWSTRREAINAAMRQCRLAEREHPTWGKKGTCALVKVK